MPLGMPYTAGWNRLAGHGCSKHVNYEISAVGNLRAEDRKL